MKPGIMSQTGIETGAENALSVTPDGTRFSTDADNACLGSSKCSASVPIKTQIQADKGTAEKKRKQEKKAKKRKKEQKKWKKEWERFKENSAYLPLCSVDPRASMTQAVSPLIPMVYDPYSEREGNHIPENLILNSSGSSGFHFGYVPKDEFNGFVGKTHDTEGHIAIFGGTGSGKSTGIAKPTVITWRAPKFVVDVKGELFSISENKRLCREIRVIDLTKEGGAYKYDPFAVLRQNEGENLVRDIVDLAQTIIQVPANITEAFWRQAAQGVLSDALLYYYDLGASFVDALIVVSGLSIKEITKKISSSSNTLAKSFINLDILESPKMCAGINAELQNQIRIYATNPVVQDALSPSESGEDNVISWDGLNKYDVYVTIDQSMLDQIGGVVALITTQLIRHLQRRPEMHTPKGKKMLPVLLLLDEFPQLGKLDVITEALSILRSKKVTISLFCQSLAQLDFLYGENTRRIICDNCTFKVILNAADHETQKYFSELVGTKNAMSKSISANYCTSTCVVSGVGLNVGESSQPVIAPHEFATLRKTVLLHPGGFSFISNPARKYSEGKGYDKNFILNRRIIMAMTIEERVKKAKEKLLKLEGEQRAKEKRERELQGKKDDRRRFIIGGLVLKHFPELLALEPRKSNSENDEEFKHFEEFLTALANDEYAMNHLKGKTICPFELAE